MIEKKADNIPYCPDCELPISKCECYDDYEDEDNDGYDPFE